MTLVLPKHVADAERARRRAEVGNAVAHSFSRGAEAKVVTERYDSDDFVSQKDVRAQLATLQKFIDAKREANPLYHLPRPSGWKLSVLIVTLPETTGGGIIMVDDAREARAVSSPQGIVLGLGPGAYKDPNKFGIDGETVPWHKAGDRISFVKYDAHLFTLANGQMIGFLNDTQPVSLIDEGWEVPA